jgi:drug/metabolite transporter (DMT)-like permease
MKRTLSVFLLIHTANAFSPTATGRSSIISLQHQDIKNQKSFPTHQSKFSPLYGNASPDKVKNHDKNLFNSDIDFMQDKEFPNMELERIKSSEPEPDMPGSGLLWRLVVGILCALWASNFAAAKLIMGEPGVDSSLYTVSRFSVAALALMPGAISAVKRGVIDWETAKGAAICGSWVSFGYLGQSLGLITTTASRSCVICTLHCVFVAAIAEYMRVQKAEGEKQFDLMRLVPAAVAVAGVAIVELKGAGGAPNIGDLFSFAQPIGFGMGYLQLEELVRKKPEAGLPISAIKLTMVALFSYALFEFSPLLHNEAFVPRIPDFTPILSSPLAMKGIAYTGLVTTALALWVESIAFKRVPATDASIILTTEPLFAALAGAVTLGETFGISDYIGASLIIAACALAVLLDDEATDIECEGVDETQGKCDPPRSRPISPN